MLFSIIVPVYNVEEYLFDAVESIINQEFDGDFEIILVNDGSTDSSLDICNSLCDGCDCITVISQKNQGLSSARNSGIKCAQGEYVIFFDSDDLMPEGTLSSYKARILDKNYPDVIVGKLSRRSFHNGHVISDNFEFDESMLLSGLDAAKLLFTDQEKPMWSACRSIFKRSSFEDSLKFTTGITSEDLDLIPKIILSANTVAFNNQITYIYRLGRPNSITNTVSRKRFYDIFKVIDGYISYSSTLDTDDRKKVVSVIIGNVVASYIVLLLKLNENDRAIVKYFISKIGYIKFGDSRYSRYFSFFSKFGFLRFSINAFYLIGQGLNKIR
ncbi:glycosyltransferase family 2 protein [Vibrio parahaemolyticus]|uniref:glycosyltransferase family 2 protein n=1 Tax=Vibrio parahaemolyticus TaxID=670 RepID=UPI002A1E4C6C|nr:glycosyltransferase family 2 protein [Vibrio parahaemolyticus]MDX8423350.1 glycosyltransferase [Vibrio parahaemolyticus]